MPDQKELIARSTTVVSAATFVSRVFGLVREQTFAYLFGAGLSVDAFVAAFRIPNLLRDLFAEGALAAAFVPVFTDTLTNKGKAEAFRLGNLVVNALNVILIVIVIAGILLSPAIVDLYAPGFGKIEGKAELTTHMTRIMFPFLLLISMAAVAMGMLNSLRHFGVPAFAPVLLNVGMIAAGFALCPFFKPKIVGMAWGVLLGGLGQWLVQMPKLWKEGFRFQFILSFRDPGVRRIMVLMTPAILGLASTQINIFVNTLIASLLPQGSVSYLNYSFRLMSFPLGVFGVAVATVTLPVVATYAAQSDIPKVCATAASSLKLVLFLTLPSIFFLSVAAHPIIATLYQHGRFSYQDTLFTAQALIFYSLGLFAYSSVRVLAPVFYALGRARIPVLISVAAVTVNIGLNLALMRPLGFKGLALATSLAALTNMGLLILILERKVGSLRLPDLARYFSRILAASAAMAAVLFLVQKGVAMDLARSGLLAKGAYLAALFVIAAGTYLALAHCLKIRELALVVGILKKKRNRGL
jgi:putative peptidoglycan lipid II flippase